METTLHVYTPSLEADSLLGQWWAVAMRDGDMEHLFVRDLPLSEWMAHWQHPRELLVAIDEQGIYFAAWFSPFLNGAIAGVWLRKDRRGEALAVSLARQAAEKAFEVWPVLVATTWRAELRGTFKAMGWSLRGGAPGLGRDGKEVLYMVCTKEQFDSQKAQKEAPDGRSS